MNNTNGIRISDPLMVADTFNSYFLHSVELLKNLSSSSCPCYLSYNEHFNEFKTNNSILLASVSLKEIEIIINGLKSGKSPRI